MYVSSYKSPLGPLYFWFKNEKLIYASFNQSAAKNWLDRQLPGEKSFSAPLKSPFRQDLDLYFSGGKVDWNWPLQLLGTPFQLAVWGEIQKIPHGGITTYKNIATSLNTRAFQAVGQAVGANPISLIVPCHRVLGTNWFGGYGGGLNLKRLLLELENVSLAPNFNA